MNCGDGASHECLAMPVIEKIVREEQPDVLLLQEGWPYGKKVLEVFGYGSYVRHHYKNNVYTFPLILTSCPVLETGQLAFGDDPEGVGTAVYALLEIEGRRVLVVSVHLKSIGFTYRTSDQTVPFQAGFIANVLYDEMFGNSIRSRSVDDLLAFLDGREDVDACIVAGDFNTVLFSSAIRKMNGGFDDALAWSLDYFRPTFHKLDFPINPRVDYIFYRGTLERVRARILPDSPGDHYPVMAEFLFKD